MSPAEFIDDPKWADFLPEFRDSLARRSLPSHDDCSPIEVEDTAGHLKRGGTLGAMPGYEERAGQLDMLRAIANAFNRRRHLMIEAGTGTGKSLAYVVPAIVWAHTNDTPVVVATATRNLQDQLISSDIPRALAVLGEEARNFKVALLKGRGNYLCLRALGEFFAAGYWTMSAAEQEEMPRFIAWLKATDDGDLDGYDGLPRSLLTCPGEECSARRCPYFSRCFVYRARRKAAEAKLIVANHALILAEAVSSAGAILPAYARLVIDEAHNLEDTATEYLSREFSLAELYRILNRLQRRGRGKRHLRGGILASIDRQLSRGVLAGSGAEAQIGRLLMDAPQHMVRLVNAAEAVIDYAATRLKVRDTVRYRSGWADAGLKPLSVNLEQALADAVKFLHSLAEALDGSAVDGEFNFCADLALQLRSVADQLVGFSNAAVFVLKAEGVEFAFWAEMVHREKRPAYIRLVGSPLSVAVELSRLLYEPKDSVVLSSATLKVGKDFRYMACRLGCVERFDFASAPSPFDYFRQCETLALDYLPDPTVDATDYVERFSAMLAEVLAMTDGRALVLFTSYEMMNAVAERSRPLFAAAALRLLVQGEGMSRESMTSALRDGERTVVFGAQSFWEGVDVAGVALSCVVIARLPFAQVRDPMVEARGEQVERSGGSAFRDYLLPEAAIRFRQGFGRLIRTKRDRGVVIVADPRLVVKNYGATFRHSIPASVHTVTSTAELVARVEGFFNT